MADAKKLVTVVFTKGQVILEMPVTVITVSHFRGQSSTVTVTTRS